jgi:MarR family transcriptional regulator, transcriptional regulator for hemolysin
MPTVTTSERPDARAAAVAQSGPRGERSAPAAPQSGPRGERSATSAVAQSGEEGAKPAAAAPRSGPHSAPAAPPSAGPPLVQPIGLAVSSTAKALNRAFTDELAQVGGSQHVWLILVALKRQRWRAQQEIAAAVGVEGPTLTHHLDRLEKAGLIERARDPQDRRAVRVELTPAGDELFHTLRKAAMAFDHCLSAGIADDDLETFRRVLAQLRENVAKS